VTCLHTISPGHISTILYTTAVTQFQHKHKVRFSHRVTLFLRVWVLSLRMIRKKYKFYLSYLRPKRKHTWDFYNLPITLTNTTVTTQNQFSLLLWTFTGDLVLYSHWAILRDLLRPRPMKIANAVLCGAIKMSKMLKGKEKFNSLYVFYTAHCSVITNENQQNAQMIYIYSQFVAPACFGCFSPSC
jgi:hypothetical protein